MRSAWCWLVPLVLLLQACPARGEGGSRTYRIATVAWAGWSPLHVADEMGFWKDLGLQVEVKDYDDPIVILEAIKAGRIDFAMDMVGSLVGVYMQGTPVVALAETDWSHGGDKVIVRRGDSVTAHRGEPVGVFLDLPSCLYFLGLYLKTQGLRLADFRVVEINSRDLTGQFVAGRIPVIVNYDPWALEAVRRGDGEVLATSADFEGCIPECMWGYREHLAGIPPEDVRKILRGWIRAASWCREERNREAFREILNRRTFRAHDAYTDEALEQILAGVRIHGPSELRERNRTGGGLYGYLEALRSFLRENGCLRRNFAPPDIFDNRRVMEVLGPGPQGAARAAAEAAPSGEKAAAEDLSPRAGRSEPGR